MGAVELFEGHRALFRPLQSPAVALGNFDGLHRGHRELLHRARAAADRMGGDAVVYTFEPHPARVLAPDLAPPLITTLDRKLELIADCGIDVAVVEPFTRELASLSPDDFLGTVVVDVLKARHVVVGYDFTYGHKRSGTTETLRASGAKAGFEVEVVDPVTIEGIIASSTKVREFVHEGNLPGARLLLGRNFEVDGVVVKGAGRGASIGVPTANLEVGNTLMPKGGVYAVRVTPLDGESASEPMNGVANLGTNPTFVADGNLVLEVHLLDFSGDLYDRRLRVGFIERLRGERRFSGVDELVAQIRADIEHARNILGADSVT
jgi:riboflavin kinase/FMN adenylyltransferase